jgi:hypothetical protein
LTNWHLANTHFAYGDLADAMFGCHRHLINKFLFIKYVLNKWLSDNWFSAKSCGRFSKGLIWHKLSVFTQNVSNHKNN